MGVRRIEYAGLSCRNLRQELTPMTQDTSAGYTTYGTNRLLESPNRSQHSHLSKVIPVIRVVGHVQERTRARC